MVIQYRNYESTTDMEMQRSFWLKVTQKLPWAWKPNRSQHNFSKDSHFNPRSRKFAFEGEKLIGYMSCIWRKGFIPFGYPWVAESYEGEIQNHLYNSIFKVATEELGGTSFLQRFREEWKTQTNFFLDKGFEFNNSYPIYIKDVPAQQSEVNLKSYTSKVLSSVPLKSLKAILPRDPRYNEGQIESTYNYSKDIDLDWILQLEHESNPIGIVCLASREDTGFAEVALEFYNNQFSDASELLFDLAVEELQRRNFNHLSLTVEERDPVINVLDQLNFKIRSQSVFYSKEM